MLVLVSRFGTPATVRVKLSYFTVLETDGDILRVNIYRPEPDGPALVGVMYVPDEATAQDLLGFLPRRETAPEPSGGRELRRMRARAPSGISGVRTR